jgi:hypothetical protein
VHISNPHPEMCQGVARWKNKRIRNNMDKAEAGAEVVMCYKCHNTGHMYKRCTAPNYGCNAPSTTVGSSTPSGLSQTPSGRSNNGRGRGRGHSNNARFVIS